MWCRISGLQISGNDKHNDNDNSGNDNSNIFKDNTFNINININININFNSNFYSNANTNSNPNPNYIIDIVLPSLEIAKLMFSAVVREPVKYWKLCNTDCNIGDNKYGNNIS